MTRSNGSISSRAQMLAELRSADRFLLATHENPDGDALGSLTGMQLVLSALGKDALAYMAAGEFPLPYEYRFIEVDNLVTEPPADLERAHDRVPRLRQHRPQPRRRRSSATARTSSTSTTTTTTRASARSTTWCPTRRARPR